MAKYGVLKRAKIPFDLKLTDAFVRSLMQIAECKPFLDEELTSPLKVKLIRQAKIRAITYSNQIEGNFLTEKAVTSLLASRHPKATDKDEREILNYQSALTYVEKLSQEKRMPSIQDFTDIQKLVTADLIQSNQSGRLRTIPVSIVNESTGREIEKCPEHFLLPELMTDLWGWLKDHEGMNPYARAFAFHSIGVAIHPFADGNGRTMRLFQHLLLLKQGEAIARFVPSETAIMKNRDRYYASIRQCRTLQSLHPILEFLAECFAQSAKDVVKEAHALFEASKRLNPEVRSRKIAAFAQGRETFQMKDLVEHLSDTPRRTLERSVEGLVSQKILGSTGEKKGRKYFIRKRGRK